jgi:hypothetical protein
MYNKDYEPIPPRLQRFLGTTARRDNIGSMQVAAVFIKDGAIAVRTDGKLPHADVGGTEISKALLTLIAELRLLHVVKVVYLGAVDFRDGSRLTRKYSFLIDAPRPRESRGVRFTELKEAVASLDPRIARLIMGRIAPQ